MPRRLAALAGIAAPVCFVTAWAVAGEQLRQYSPVREHISELARVGVETRPLMTSGMVAFGALAPLWSRSLQGPARTTVLAAGVGSLGVAAAPLGASWGDTPHVVAAGVTYVAMAASPTMDGNRAVGALSGALLLGSLADSPVTGLLQRAGLGVVDAWFVVRALKQLRG
ncbi:MAG: hypothetical protein JWO22_3073 [Frankiales bacterium]|nr:hypothetical protein [Frankiales bacterium]